MNDKGKTDKEVGKSWALQAEIDKAETIPSTPAIAEPIPDDMPITQKGVEIVGGERAYIYDTRTGLRSLTLLNMLPAQLRKKRADKSLRFTTTKPVNPPDPFVMGTMKCLLHADDPNREHWDAMGLPVCKKHNITSPYQVKRHMMKRHKQEWAMMEDEKKTEKEETEQKFQRAVFETVLEKGKIEALKKFPCPKCPKSYDTQNALAGHLKVHNT